MVRGTQYLLIFTAKLIVQNADNNISMTIYDYYR